MMISRGPDVLGEAKAFREPNLVFKGLAVINDRVGHEWPASGMSIKS